MDGPKAFEMDDAGGRVRDPDRMRLVLFNLADWAGWIAEESRDPTGPPDPDGWPIGTL